MKSRVSNRVLLALGFFLLGQGTTATALSFWPTDAEWATWPEYCRVRYIKSAAGRDSEFANQIDPGQIAAWHSKLGDAWYGLHHHCAGLALMERARVEQDAKRRERLLRDALGEHNFTLNRTSKTNPMHAEIATKIGLTHRSLGELPQAVRFFEMAMAEQPALPGGYQGKAMVLRDARKFSEARDVLLVGDKATEGQSAELKYFLGLVLLDMKDYEGAKANARLAYELGYPLPGLREKLARAGHPL